MKEKYRKISHRIVAYLTLVVCSMHLAACNNPQLNMTPPKEEASKKEKEAAQQRITDRKALAQKVATQAIEDMNTEAGSSQFWSESPLLQKQHARLLKAITATSYVHEPRHHVLVINTGPGAFEPADLLSRRDVYSYDCETRKITFTDGTSGYYPEALTERDKK